MVSPKSPSRVKNFPKNSSRKSSSPSSKKSAKPLTKSQRYNKRVINCLKGCNLRNANNNNNKNKAFVGNVPFKTEKEYNTSFSDIISFSKKFTAVKKRSVDCIVFNGKNADGILSAMLYTNFLLSGKNKKSNIYYINTGPSHGSMVNKRFQRHEQQMKDKTVLVVDLAYNKIMIDYLRSKCKELIVIDDHTDNSDIENDNIFVGKEHGTVAYVWKFLYPTKDVPMYIQMFDNDDRNLHLPYLTHNKSYTTFFNYRAFHNPFLKYQTIEDFIKLHDIIEHSSTEFTDVVGHYYFEVVDNLKEQIARNAQLRYFDGKHPIYVLNFKDPALYKMVAKQMITNAKNRGHHIDFAVLWGYEYTNDCYNIHLNEGVDNKPKHNLPNIATQLGTIGGTGKGGFGTKMVGNFYWPHQPGKDIWDLISKTKRPPKFLK